MNAPLALNTTTTHSPDTVLDVAIIGTGFSGLGMGIRLKQAGIHNFQLFEKGHDVGGTWRDNTYPGCACDIKSQLYSYSFEPSANWSHLYANQGEIYQYIRHCADKYGMYPHIQFNCAVTGARFDADAGQWQLTLSTGAMVRAKHVVAATGPFSAPAIPNLVGQDRFSGTIMHTATWDHSVDLTGKRVALIGTGASAIQVAPAIAGRVAQLTVYQRTPNWIMPRPDREVTAREKQLNQRVPAVMKAARLGNYWFNEVTAPFLVLKYDAFKSHPEKIARNYLQRKVKDPVLRQKLTPDYKFGCKRVLVSSEWYNTLQQPNVSLIDGGIEQLTANGILGKDGIEHAYDVIILATGYQVRHTGSPFEVIGLQGASLNAQWRNGAEAFNGISAQNFPNLYFLVGPFTGPGHTSVIAYAEAQIDYVLQGIELAKQRNIKYMVVRPEAEAAFVKHMDQRSEHTVWKSGCANWYLSPNGRNNTLYPGFNAEYRARVMRFNPAHYVLVGQDGQPRAVTFADHVQTAWHSLTV